MVAAGALCGQAHVQVVKGHITYLQEGRAQEAEGVEGDRGNRAAQLVSAASTWPK